MLIIDAHLDLAWNALQWNRNLGQSVYTIRTQESNLSGADRGRGTVALPEMRNGRVALCFATLLARSTGRAVPNLDYSSHLQAYAVAQGQLAYYQALSESGEARVIKNLTELDSHIIEWEQWESDTQQIHNPETESNTGVERSGCADHQSCALWSGSICRWDVHRTRSDC